MLSRFIRDVNTIEDVVATMRAIDAALPDEDGVKWFNFLYLKVTEAVRADTTWQDRPFLERFDVMFAGLYFDAIVKWEQNQTLTPHAWRPLFHCRRDRALARVQFALAGMNAHINHDLAIALDRMTPAGEPFPTRASARYNDFTHVNDILERLESELREQLSTGLVAAIDLALGDLDSIIMMWNVRKAREAAWTHGEVLCHLRTAPALQRDYLARLDQMVAFAGRGLLVPRLDPAGGGAKQTAKQAL